MQTILDKPASFRCQHHSAVAKDRQMMRHVRDFVSQFFGKLRDVFGVPPQDLDNSKSFRVTDRAEFFGTLLKFTPRFHRPFWHFQCLTQRCRQLNGRS